MIRQLVWFVGWRFVAILIICGISNLGYCAPLDGELDPNYSTEEAFNRNQSSKRLVGWVEKVFIEEANFVVHGKIDSGADHSSLGATNIKLLKKDGVEYVSFDVENDEGEKVRLQLPVERKARIRRHGKKLQERYVVVLGVCVGDMYRREDVNLVNRSEFDYRLLVGRSFIVGNAVIDPSLMYFNSPKCKIKKKTN